MMPQCNIYQQQQCQVANSAEGPNISEDSNKYPQNVTYLIQDQQQAARP